MIEPVKHILLAEDDEDDSQFFEEALNSIENCPTLIRARDGVELTGLLNSMTSLPNLIFLDLNMPRKNGAQCLLEIREQQELLNVPVVVLSTSSNKDIIDTMYQSGANLYIQKPSDHHMWKRALAKVLRLDWNMQPPFPVKESFLMTEF